MSSALYHKLTNDEVPPDLHITLTNGDNVSVICLPEDPKTARLGDKIPDSLVGPVTLILIGIAGVIIALPIASALVYFFVLVIVY